MENAGDKKKHSTTMREFREMEKRLLNVQREHNKLLRQRNFLCKSASSTRPYLSEKIVAKLRPHTAPLGYLKKASVKEWSTDECASKKIGRSVGFEGEVADIDQGEKANNTDEESEAKPSNIKKHRETNDWHAKHGKHTGITATRITSSKTSLRSCSRNSSANNWNRNRPLSVGSRNSSARGRNSSAISRSVPSEMSHLEKNRNKSWVYQPMSIHPERQSIYTLVVPPVQAAEEARRRLKKRKRGHVAWMDNNEHVVRFQGIPRHFYIHDKEHKSTQFDMDKLKHCRYLR